DGTSGARAGRVSMRRSSARGASGLLAADPLGHEVSVDQAGPEVREDVVRRVQLQHDAGADEKAGAAVPVDAAAVRECLVADNPRARLQRDARLSARVENAAAGERLAGGSRLAGRA